MRACTAISEASADFAADLRDNNTVVNVCRMLVAIGTSEEVACNFGVLGCLLSEPDSAVNCGEDAEDQTLGELAVCVKDELDEALDAFEINCDESSEILGDLEQCPGLSADEVIACFDDFFDDMRDAFSIPLSLTCSDAPTADETLLPTDLTAILEEAVANSPSCRAVEARCPGLILGVGEASDPDPNDGDGDDENDPLDPA